jgi:DNA-binding NtrC family response regulator
MVAQGLFRQDLLFRLNLLQLDLPPLRRRKTDIPPLAEHLY